MENKNWLQKKVSNIESNIRNMDNDFAKIPPYKAGKKAGGFFSNLIDIIIDGIVPPK